MKTQNTQNRTITRGLIFKRYSYLRLLARPQPHMVVAFSLLFAECRSEHGRIWKWVLAICTSGVTSFY
jgi:hypothetical protein